MDREEEVFIDAEEEITPRRTGRKRRSTAGSSVPPGAGKKPKTKMPLGHSPKKGAAGAKQTSMPASAGEIPSLQDQDAFWAKMGGCLGVWRPG